MPNDPQVPVSKDVDGFARSVLYGCMGHLGISEMSDEAVASVAARLEQHDADLRTQVLSQAKEAISEAWTNANAGTTVTEACLAALDALSPNPNYRAQVERETLARLSLVLPTIQRVLRNDLTNAVDNVNRAEAQQERMAYDHDNNDSLERYRKWATDTRLALDAIVDAPDPNWLERRDAQVRLDEANLWKVRMDNYQPSIVGKLSEWAEERIAKLEEGVK